MAKFAVGETALWIGPRSYGAENNAYEEPVKVIWVGFKPEDTNWAEGYYDVYGSWPDYTIEWSNGNTGVCGEQHLRKLPPDSHADNTTEDPGVTRIKKLLEQDQPVHKQPKPVKA